MMQVTEQDEVRRLTVTIMLCNYNDAQFLPSSLNAIGKQTRPADEIIIVDDGSSDQSVDIIEEFAKQQINVKVLRNKENEGLLFSINRALGAATMDFVIWAAADDMLLPNFVERNLAMLERNPGAAMSFSRLATFRDGTDVITHYTPEKFHEEFDLGVRPHYMDVAELNKRFAQSHLWMSANTVVARRDALLAIGGFDAKLRWHADWFAYYVILLRHGACVIPETLAIMRERPETFSRIGMRSRDQQRRTLINMVSMLHEPQYNDIRAFILCRPSILSPYGKHMLYVLLREPRYWRLAVPFGRWFLNHWWQVAAKRKMLGLGRKIWNFFKEMRRQKLIGY